MSGATIAALVGYGLVVGAAFRRNRRYGIFALVILSFPLLSAAALQAHLGPLGELFPWLVIITQIHFGLLVFGPGMRSWPIRALVSVPALWFVASSFLAVPWALVAAVGLPPYGAWIPFGLGFFGLLRSFITLEETVDLRLDNDDDAGELKRWPKVIHRGLRATDPGPVSLRPLTLVQITDPHLGPFMPVARLRRICSRAVEREPDLILITGDMLTMESRDANVLRRALEPLAAYRGRVFACLGNHDLEARSIIEEVYEELGIRLLVDDVATITTPAGPVQIVGADFVWRGRKEHLRALCAAYPRRDDHLRLILLHDPGAFRHLPPGEGDLVLSGHTHGGQVGLVSLGLPWTALSLISSIPDHGMWARGNDRLYVHRAQGHYGFPLRLGVPSEQSLMRVHL